MLITWKTKYSSENSCPIWILRTKFHLKSIINIKSTAFTKQERSISFLMNWESFLFKHSRFHLMLNVFIYMQFSC